MKERVRGSCACVNVSGTITQQNWVIAGIGVLLVVELLRIFMRERVTDSRDREDEENQPCKILASFPVFTLCVSV